MSTRKTCGVVGAVLVAAMFALLLSGASIAGTSSSTGIPSLVNQYEHYAPFRGVANGNLPATLGQGLHLGVADVTLPSSTVGVAGDGYVSYGSFHGATVIASSDGPGMDRFALVLSSPSDPTEFSLDVALPEDATVVNEPTGAIAIASSEGDTTIVPATAVDAAGHLVPAKYSIVGGRLVINVSDAHAAFPVMVDPVSSAYWWGTQTWYSRSDVRNYASWYGIIGVASVACRDFGPLAGLCSRVVGAYTGGISSTWAYAKATNQCLTMKMLWTGQVTGVSAYGCNWG